MITLTEEQLSSSGTTAAGKDSKKSPASSGRRLDTSDLQEGRGGRRYVNGTFPREQDRDSKFSSSAPSSRIRVLIAANSKTEARSLSAMLSDRNEFMVVGTATTFNELDATLHLRTDVDVLVTDVELGGATVFPIVEKAVTLRPNLNVLCYTNRSEPNFIMNAIRAGALGYVLRNSQESLDNCVRLINGGGSPMSPAAKDFAKIPENAESKAVDREKEEYPVQQVAVTYPIGEKEVKDAVKELNPDTDSLGSRG